MNKIMLMNIQNMLEKPIIEPEPKELKILGLKKQSLERLKLFDDKDSYTSIELHRIFNSHNVMPKMTPLIDAGQVKFTRNGKNGGGVYDLIK